MNLSNFAHTKESYIRNIIEPYLNGYCVEAISIRTNSSQEEVNNIIDCYNYCYV